MSAALRGDLSPDDVVQETHLASARRIDEFEPRGPASFYRWLVGIARNKVREAERRRRAKKRAVLAPLAGEPAGDQTSPSGRVRGRERRELLLDAVRELPGAQGEAVRLRYLEGRSVAETARVLDRSESAVKALVSRGLAQLGTRLDTGI
jgi:RNA polymerase sigma-70 factor (ECF subfamily)